jgi:hypothetical protein
LKKAVTYDRSGSALSGKVIGDSTPPPHITSTPPTYEPDTSFLPRTSEDNSNPHLSHRQSIDWYAGLAADHGAPRDKELSLPATVEEDELEPTPVSVPNIQIETIVDNNDPLEDVDRSVGAQAWALVFFVLTFLQNIALELCILTKGNVLKIYVSGLLLVPLLALNRHFSLQRKSDFDCTSFKVRR